jgi:PilZ domain
MNRHTSATEFAKNIDRRRSARYSCGGLAQIKCLPLDGALLKGRLRDLGLGGCCIENVETTSPFDLGMRTEILIEVDSWIFRAMALVRALRDRSGISVEFAHMSAGGQNRLADLIADLEKPRPGQYARRLPQPAVWNQLETGQARMNPAGLGKATSASNRGVAIVGTIVPPETTEETMSAIRQAWSRRLHPGATSLDIFV